MSSNLVFFGVLTTALFACSTAPLPVGDAGGCGTSSCNTPFDCPTLTCTCTMQGYGIDAGSSETTNTISGACTGGCCNSCPPSCM